MHLSPYSLKLNADLGRMEELNHDLNMKNHFKIAQDLHQDKKASIIRSMTNKLGNFIARNSVPSLFTNQ